MPAAQQLCAGGCCFVSQDGTPTICEEHVLFYCGQKDGAAGLLCKREVRSWLKDLIAQNGKI